MTRMIALLRGINLGAHNRIGMADLREALQQAGCDDVRTHLQSGNVVLTADQAPGDVATKPSWRFVVFLGAEPDPAALEAIAQEDLGSERIDAGGREIHVWCPEGVRNSRAMKLVNRVAPGATFRNWNTVTRLAEMAGE